jgi:hypothetical protein
MDVDARSWVTDACNIMDHLLHIQMTRLLRHSPASSCPLSDNIYNQVSLGCRCLYCHLLKYFGKQFIPSANRPVRMAQLHLQAYTLIYYRKTRNRVANRFLPVACSDVHGQINKFSFALGIWLIILKEFWSYGFVIVCVCACGCVYVCVCVCVCVCACVRACVRTRVRAYARVRSVIHKCQSILGLSPLLTHFQMELKSGHKS